MSLVSRRTVIAVGTVALVALALPASAGPREGDAAWTGDYASTSTYWQADPTSVPGEVQAATATRTGQVSAEVLVDCRSVTQLCNTDPHQAAGAAAWAWAGGYVGGTVRAHPNRAHSYVVTVRFSDVSATSERATGYAVSWVGVRLFDHDTDHYCDVPVPAGEQAPFVEVTCEVVDADGGWLRVHAYGTTSAADGAADPYPSRATVKGTVTEIVVDGAYVSSSA